MKAYDLQPTYENLLNTFTNDTIGRNSDVFHFVDILDSAEDNCSIALEGKWGSGKTFFVKQAKMVLDAHNDFLSNTCEEDRKKIKDLRASFYRNSAPELQPQVCVYYDAWENDNDDDPILSLVYTILHSTESDFSFKDTSCLKVAAGILEVFTGREWTQLIESLKGENPLDKLNQDKAVEERVHEFLESLLPEKGNRLVIFIDELDRCKPSYAVKLLERIKHYFVDDKITFVFSVNIDELQYTIRKYYGEGFDGSRYLDRFFDLRVSLPAPNMQKYYQSLGFFESNYYYDIVCGAVIKAYHFGLREIAKYLRLTKIAAYEPTHSSSSFEFSFADGRAIQFCLFYVVPIMIGLKILDARKYTSFIQGTDGTPLLEISRFVSVHTFGKLLGVDETYSEKEAQQGKTLVTIESKLNLVYSALFEKDYALDRRDILIGDLEFSARTKEILLRTASLLSGYAKVDKN